MREQDSGNVPEIPSEDELTRRGSITKSRSNHHLFRTIAVAASVVAVAVGVLLNRSLVPPEQDPGAVYAAIMSTSSMATDDFMLVSPGEFPEITSMPDIYGVDSPLAPLEITN